MKILCLGHITYDITFPVDSYPKENTKTRYFEKTECAGGPSSIAAFLLGKWHQDVGIAGLVGNDNYGNKIKKEFILNHVNTKYLMLAPKVETGHALILANRSNGTRTIFSYVSKTDKLKPFVLEKAPDILLIDGHEYEASKHLLKTYPNMISIIDAGRSKKEVIELAKMCHYVVCSKEFAQNVTGFKIDFNNKSSLIKIYKKMEEIFPGIIVITLEDKGCLYSLNNQIKIMPAIKVKTVDSTGAGDIFHGAFTYGIAEGFDFEKVIKYASIAGALSVTKVGGYKSIPSLEEMASVYDEIS